MCGLLDALGCFPRRSLDEVCEDAGEGRSTGVIFHYTRLPELVALRMWIDLEVSPEQITCFADY